jgi:predicted transcriptional regulator
MITVPSLPGCEFASRELLLENARHCLQVQAAIEEFKVTGDEMTLYRALLESGEFTAEEIAEIVRTGERRMRYCSIADVT